MYLTDLRENTLQDVITKLEPGLFLAVTGLTVKDFHMLVRLKVFNTEQMNAQAKGDGFAAADGVAVGHGSAEVAEIVLDFPQARGPGVDSRQGRTPQHGRPTT